MSTALLWSERARPLPSADDMPIAVAVSARPWILPVDTLIVVEPAGTESPVDRALADQFPSLTWHEFRGRSAARVEPMSLGVRDGLEPVGTLSRIVASPTLGDQGIVAASAHGIGAAAPRRDDRLALYVHGYPSEVLGRELAPASVGSIVADVRDRIGSLLIVVSSRDEADIIWSIWNGQIATGSADEGAPGPTPPERLAGGISADLVHSDRGIPGDADTLGWELYVTMLATAIVRRDTPLPLSFGLFGPWGSGKSSFMGLLREQVSRRSRSTDPCVAGEVVQIGFNAWTYADTNLWASLGDAIFTQLLDAGRGGDPARHEEHQRRVLRAERLRRDLQAQLSVVRELEAARARAEDETRRIDAEIARARDERRTTLSDLAGAALRSASSDDIRALWRLLGITSAVEQGRCLAEETSEALDRLTAIRALLRGRRFTAAAVLAGVLGLLFVVLVATGRPAAWIAGVGFGGVAAWVGVITVALRRTGTVLARLRSTLAELRRAELAREMAAVRDAAARERALENELEIVQESVSGIEAELTELTPGGQLYRFLAERVSAPAYAGQLGLVSTIRRDLETLVRIMAEWSCDPIGSPPPIERIVLYIDDLDRCHPRQVVEVLQAVHLLLALELFVVVVGVDPRWLRYSLTSEYHEMFASELSDTTELGDRRASARDYLEKIFNVPFVIPPLTPDGFTSMIRDLAISAERVRSGGGRDTGRVSTESVPPGSAPDAMPGDGGRGDPDSVDRLGAPTPITEPELVFIGELAPLIRSPREAKRMFNIYRMLRSASGLVDRSFVGPRGDHQAVAFLLACQSFAPHLLEQLLWARPDPERRLPGGLAHRPADTPWNDVLPGLLPRRSDGRWANDVCAELTQPQVRAWRQLLERCRPAAEAVSLGDLSAFQQWAPHVSRFAFVAP